MTRHPSVISTQAPSAPEVIPYEPDPALVAKARQGVAEFKAKRDDSEINEWFIDGDKA